MIKFLKKLSVLVIPIIAIIMLGFTIISISKKNLPDPREIKFTPPKSIYTNQIGGIGIVEPRTSLRKIMPHLKGIVTQIYVNTGQHVEAGQPLFTIDDRATLAERVYADAKVDSAKIHYEDLKYNFELFKDLAAKGAASHEEVTRKKYLMMKSLAKLNEEIANRNIIDTKYHRLTVRSPISAKVLDVNVEVGEYADTNNNEPPIIIGDLSEMLVTVSIDEIDIHRFTPKSTAYGILRGTSNQHIPLKFIQIKPHITNKSQITNSPGEKIDTKVMEITYHFDNKKFSAYPGQRMDVFIEDSNE